MKPHEAIPEVQKARLAIERARDALDNVSRTLALIATLPREAKQEAVKQLLAAASDARQDARNRLGDALAEAITAVGVCVDKWEKANGR